MNKQLVHSIFEKTVFENPDKIAIQEERKAWSFGTLNISANRVAHALMTLGVRKGDVVGTFMKCTGEYVASILGINKAGAAFMPLETDFPVKRTISMLEFATPVALITCPEYLDAWRSLLKQLPQAGYRPSWVLSVALTGDGWRMEVIGEEEEESRAFIPAGEENPAIPLAGDDTNYIFYTSGSTGEPKQIEGCHKGLSHFIHWEIAKFGIDAGCRVSQLAPVSFDVSLRDIFVPLLSGGTLCIPGTDIRMQPAAFLHWLSQSHITLMHCVPTFLRLLTDELKGGGVTDWSSDLHHILLAGEPLFGRDIMNWRAVAGDQAQLVNIYGPSETTLAKMYHCVPPADIASSSIIPLGQPIANTIVMLLKDGRLCEIGELGEIYIKTPFRTKGYYKNDRLTRERFVQNPLNAEKGDIVYKTGDLGRYNEDMDIVFAGREDSQIKIRGNRVELQEIESVLAGLEKVRRSLVIVYRNNEGEDALACYYTSDDRLEESAIRDHLREFVPEYMIPSVFIKISEFPLNRNGKVDRQALPAPQIAGRMSYEEPANELEQKLESIFKEVLGLPCVGRRESFFSIGWSSLKGIKIISKIFKICNIVIKLPDLFSHPTIAELAGFLSSSVKKKFEEIRPLPDGLPYYEVSWAQRRFWILSQFQEENVAYNIFYAWSLSGSLDMHAFRKAFREIICRHESLRTVFAVVDGEPVQKILAPESVWPALEEYTLPDQTGESDAKIMELMETECRAQFDLANGPLIRARLFTISREKYVFFLTLHHIISDGWSMNVFLFDLLKMYDAYSRNSSPDLKPLTFQYRDFAAWQNRLLSGKELQEYDSYWMGQFSGPLPILNLPFDKPRPALKTFNGNILHTRLPPELTDKLKKLSGDQQATVFMTILASVNILFHKFSGQEDIIIGIPAAGREHADLDNQVGLYVNTLAIRTHLNDTDTFLRVLSKIKKSTLDAQRYQAYPFDLLVDHLKLDRDLSRSTLFDVMVVFHDTKQRDQELATPPLKDIEANKYDTKKGSTKFDFTLHFSETEEDIGLELDYNTDLFSDGRIREIMDYYLALLSSIVSVPNSTIGLLDYIPEKYKERLNNKAIGIIDGYYSGISRVLDKYVEKGRLITGATAKILDSSGGWIPEGMRGEIYIDYKGALTGTGTIGMTQGKSIRYLGRKESERDWKGQKINLDQLDHYLKRFPGVIDAASAIVPGTSGTDSLLACIGSDEDIDPTEMAGFLELHLSYFLPPDKLVFQEPGNLPVTVEDWQHICQVAEEQEEENKEFEAPRTAIEMKLSDITSRICDGQSISIRENFFTAGFNSLKAMRLMVAINKELGIKLNLTQIFSHPTLESLAKSIDPVALEELSSDLSSKMAI